MKMKKRFLGILLSLVMVLGLMPGMSLTAYAWDSDPYASLLNSTTVVHFDGKDWYLIADNSEAANIGTVTLLSKECVAASQFSSNKRRNTYSGSAVETAVNNYYTNSISSDAKTAVVDGNMFLLTIDQAKAITNVNVRKCSQYPGTYSNSWWLSSPSPYDMMAACVWGNGYVNDLGYLVEWALGVRPALKLNLSSVIFSSESKTFTLNSSPSDSFYYADIDATDQQPVSDMVLSLGSTGEAVVSLQQALEILGYPTGGIDGDFGPVTETAVKAFQKDNGLYVDGVVGPYTWAALRGADAPTEPAGKAEAPQTGKDGGDLVYGMTSDEIAYVQMILDILGYNVGAIDGYFGDVTLEAVKAFQRDYGLYVDGIIGAQTKAALGIQ